MNPAKLAFHMVVLRAKNEAVGAWLRLWAWAEDHGTDGVVSVEVLKLIARRPAVVKKLLEVGLVEQVGDDYLVRELAAPARDARAVAVSEARRKAGAAGAAARWGSRPVAVAEPTTDGNCHPEPMAIAIPDDGNCHAAADGKTLVCHSEIQTETRSHSPESPSEFLKKEGEKRGCGSPVQEETASARADGKPDGIQNGKPDDLGPEAAAVLEQLRAARALVVLATEPFAEHVAGWVVNGRLELADALHALEACEAQHAGELAAGAPPLTREQYARAAVGFLRRTRRGEARAAAARTTAPPSRVDAAPSPEQVAAGQRALDAFRAAYEASGRRYGPYLVAPPSSRYAGDERAAVDVAHEARRYAAEEAARRGAGADVEALERELVTHWTRAYLAQDGTRGYLAERRHPFRHLIDGLETYGLPWSRRPRAVRSEPSARAATVGPPADFMATFGRGPVRASPAGGEEATGT